MKVWLQWGHDKIVMEVRIANELYPFTVKLQWGHDKIVMEVYYMIMIMILTSSASMGP